MQADVTVEALPEATETTAPSDMEAPVTTRRRATGGTRGRTRARKTTGATTRKTTRRPTGRTSTRTKAARREGGIHHDPNFSSARAASLRYLWRGL